MVNSYLGLLVRRYAAGSTPRPTSSSDMLSMAPRA